MTSTGAVAGGTAASHEIRHAKTHEEALPLWWPNMITEQWNRGPADLSTYLDHSKSDGLLLGFAEGEKTPIGHVAAVVNENLTGWVSMLIVKAEYRQMRLGAALWLSMMQDFRAAGTEYIGLDGVPQQKQTYERRGFVESSLGVVKYMVKPLNTVNPVPDAGSVKALREVDPILIAKYDLKTTGFYRPGLWTSLMKREDVVGLVATELDEDSKAETITGLTTLRRAPMGLRLGPLYANSTGIAKSLLAAIEALATPQHVRQHPVQDFPLHLLNNEDLIAQASICAEVWTGNPASEQLFGEHGWAEAAFFYRMWLHDKATPEQSKGGQATSSMFAVFDAAVG